LAGCAGAALTFCVKTSRHRPTIKRIAIMIEGNIGLDLSDEELLAYAVSDEALEAAASAASEKARALTVQFCTGNIDCPF
jgi:hypothetical protein